MRRVVNIDGLSSSASCYGEFGSRSQIRESQDVV
jgi:hypothetical protein